MSENQKSELNKRNLPELWEWAEYYCPWCYIAAVRFHKLTDQYKDKVFFRNRAFPLEVYGGGPAPYNILEQEIWLAAIQENDAEFKPLTSDWPTTTLPAFDAAWCANQQGYEIGLDFDLRIRRAFFAEGRNIGKPEVMIDLAKEAGLDMSKFTKQFESGEARAAILEEGKLGKEQFGVRGTPIPMLGNGEKLRHSIAYPRFKEGKVVSVGQLPDNGTDRLDSVRQMFEKAAAQ